MASLSGMSPPPMLTTLMHAVRLIAPIVALVFAGSCRRVQQVCPQGMRVVEQRTVADQSVWCKSADGRTAQWTEMNKGSKRQVCQYLDGRAHGPFRAFYPGGARWIEGLFEDGVEHGQWHQWDETGSPSADAEYRTGLLVQGAPVASAAKCMQAKP
jgi:hypothetical protein